MRDELKPCPFCGGDASVSQNDRLTRWGAYCLDCSAEILDELTEEKAVAAWNTRAQLSAQSVSAVQPVAEQAPMLADSREEFENWYVDHGYGSGNFKGTTPPSRQWYYFDELVDAAWSAWQAALTGKADADAVDAKRLDFVISNYAWVEWKNRDDSIMQCQLMTQNEDEEYIALSGVDKFFNTLREAIDAAIAAQSTEGAKG